jgi:hypothetical protein
MPNSVFTTPRSLVLALTLFLLAGCDMLGLPNHAREAAQVEANAKAVGASCRHAGRALEDCYALNPKHPLAQVYAGWKEMNDYMAAGNIAVVPPKFPKRKPRSAGSDEDEEEEEADVKEESHSKKEH